MILNQSTNRQHLTIGTQVKKLALAQIKSAGLHAGRGRFVPVEEMSSESDVVDAPGKKRWRGKKSRRTSHKY